jgi:GNAT superfamily N-acetyltransferase
MAILHIVPLTDEAGKVTEPELLAAAAACIASYAPCCRNTATAMQQKCNVSALWCPHGGGTGCDGTPLGLALYRVYENTYEDLRLYIDDLVSDEAHRSQGIGSQLLDWCANEARRLGCGFQVLDSGTWRTEAHRLYFRKGFSITSFHFTKPLN